MKTNVKRLLFFLAVFAVISPAIALGGCGGGDPSQLPYLDDELTISGLGDGDFTVTVSDLTELDMVSKKAEAMRSNGDIVKITAVGPLLTTFLEKYGGGKEIADFSAVRFSSRDGYSIAVPKEILEKREVVIAYMDGKKAFPKDIAPLRAVVIGERAMYWAYMMNKIAFETGTADSLTDKVVFLDTALPILKGEYSEEEGGDIVSAIDILSKYGGMEEGGKVYLSASDGLKKNETIENFLKGYVKYTGDNIPQFCSPELPEGMNMNGVVTLRVGGVAYVSLERGAEVWPGKEAEGMKGVGFSDVVKDQGFDRTGLFQMTDKEGGSFLFTEQEITKGVFSKDGDEWNFYLEGRDPVKGALSVETQKEQP
jgi:hypothetical protein